MSSRSKKQNRKLSYDDSFNSNKDSQSTKATVSDSNVTIGSPRDLPSKVTNATPSHLTNKIWLEILDYLSVRDISNMNNLAIYG